MTSTFLLLLSPLVIILTYAIIAARRAFQLRDNIPGPSIARWTNFYRVWMFSRGRGPLLYAQLHRRYGPVVRMGPHYVSVIKPDMIPIIYDAKQSFRKSKFYHVFRPLYRGVPMDTALTMKNPHQQRILKQPIITHMTGLTPRLLLPTIENSITDLVSELSKRSGQSVDFCNWAFYWAYDLTHMLMFGSYAGYLRSGTDFDSTITAFIEITRVATLIGFVPEHCDWLLAKDRNMRVLRKFQRFPDPTQVVLSMIDEKIKDHEMGKHECNEAVICRLLRDRDLSIKERRYEAVNVLFEAFFAGAAELGVSLNSIFCCLLANPGTLNNLTETLRRGRPEDHQSSQFLNAVIQESLRIYTSNGPPMERIAPDDLIVGPHVIKKGTVLGMPQYALHRDASIYGPDVDNFRPERWLEADQASKNLMERSFMPFGKGSRACPGRNLAMLQLRVVLIGLLRNFNIRLTNPEKPIHVKAYWVIEFTGIDITFFPVKIEKVLI